MVTVDASAPQFDMGRVLKRTVSVLGRRWLTFGLFALVLTVAPQVFFMAGVMKTVMADIQSGAGNVNFLEMWPKLAGVYAAMLLGALLLNGAIVYGTVADLSGGRVSFGDCAVAALRSLLPLVVLSILMMVPVMLGYILFIVPGVLLSLVWSMAMPAVIAEKRGIFASFGRSASLTKGHRWAILGLFLIAMVIAFGVGIVAGVVGMIVGLVSSGFDPVASTTVQVVVQQGVTGFASVAMAVGIGALFFELRSAKEGPGPQAVTAVFD